jgi:tetratricopeptide (TPR) repeat protein
VPRAIVLLLTCLATACSLAEDPLAAAHRLHAEGRFEETVDPLRAVLDEDPDNHEASLLLGVALLRGGSAGMAVWPLRKASEAPQYAVEAGLRLTEAMLESRTAPDALRAIEQVLALEPDNAEALLLRAKAYLSTSQLEEGLADLDRLESIDPENLSVLVPRVTTLIALGQIDEAEDALKAARALLETTDRELPEGVRPRLCVAAAMFAFERGEAEAADAQYTSCLEAYPREALVVGEAIRFFDRIDEPERATALLEEGMAQHGDRFFRIALAARAGARGDDAAQERLLREEVAEHPEPGTWFALADFHVRREQWEPALEAFEQALALETPTTMLRFAYADTLVQAGRAERALQVARQLEQPELRTLIRGRALLEQGRPDAALAAFDEGIPLWPNNAAGRFLAGQAAERSGRFDRAISEYREALRANAAASDAGLALAGLHQIRGERDAAIDAILRFMRSRPREPDGYVASVRLAGAIDAPNVRSEAMRRLTALPGQGAVALALEAEAAAAAEGPQAAVALLEGADIDRSDPANAAAIEKLADALSQLGRHDEALQLLRSATAAHADAAVLHRLNARALSQAGDPETARQSLGRALELEPESAATLRALGDLEGGAGHAEAALDLYDRAIRVDPSDPAAALAAIRLVAQDPQRGDEVVQRLGWLLARHPREAAASYQLARRLAERGDTLRALAYAERALWLREPRALAEGEWIETLRTAARADAGASES